MAHPSHGLDVLPRQFFREIHVLQICDVIRDCAETEVEKDAYDGENV